jgi:hypothetical protein
VQLSKVKCTGVPDYADTVLQLAVLGDMLRLELDEQPEELEDSPAKATPWPYRTEAAFRGGPFDQAGKASHGT